MPFLMIEGSGFMPGVVRNTPSSVIDLAPTIPGHLGISADGCEGRPMQQR
jgi:arylsulfatase A-like enzyme